MQTPEEHAEEAIRVEELQAALARTQRQLAQAKDRTTYLTNTVITAASDAILALPRTEPVRPKLDRRVGGEETALWHLTDWQGHKLTSSYNGEVMRDRVQRYCAVAERITAIQRADHPVRECVIMFGGDMVEGLFQFPTQSYEIDATLFEQFASVSRLEENVVRSALNIYDRVTVVAEWGNHGRIGSKRDHIPRADNFDRMTYETARRVLLSDPKLAGRLIWEDSGEDVQRVEVGAYRALLIHGDEVGRNGFASPMTIAQHCNRWRSGAYPWEFRDVYVGHFHNHMELSLANGEGSVYWTGSTESDNRYARDTMAASALPSQRLHFIDPQAGRVTAQYRVWV